MQIKGREDGYMDTPNILMEIYDRDGTNFTFKMKSISSYEEEYDSQLGPIVKFTSTLMCPEWYDYLTSPNSMYIITKEMVWRSSEDGEDYEHRSLPLNFKYLTLKHAVDNKVPALWEFELRN